MIQYKTTVLYGALDGVIRGGLMYALCEYIVSQYSPYNATHHIAAAVVFATISIGLSLILARNAHKISVFYLVGQACFVLFFLLIFINFISIGLHIFPQRELGNADGLLIMFVQGFYLFMSEPIRLVILFAMSIHRKCNNHKHQD